MAAAAELARPLGLEVAGELNVQDIVNQEGSLPNFSFPPELEVIFHQEDPVCVLPPPTIDYATLPMRITHLDLFREYVANLVSVPEEERPSWTAPLLWFFDPKTHRDWSRESLLPQVAASEIGQVMGTSRKGISFYLVPTSEPFYIDDLGLGVQDFNVRQAIRDPQRVEVGQTEQVTSPLVPFQRGRDLTGMELSNLRNLTRAFVDTLDVIVSPIKAKIDHTYGNPTNIDSFSFIRLLRKISGSLEPDQFLFNASLSTQSIKLDWFRRNVGAIATIQFENGRCLVGSSITAHKFMKEAEFALRKKVSANLLEVQKAAMGYITALVSQSETFCRLPRGRRDELISILKYYIFTWPYVLADLYQRTCWQPLNEYARRVEGIDLTP